MGKNLQAERADYLLSDVSQGSGSYRGKPASVRQIKTNMITEHTGLEGNKIPDSPKEFITTNVSVNVSVTASVHFSKAEDDNLFVQRFCSI